jgi:hypothetical protein
MSQLNAVESSVNWGAIGVIVGALVDLSEASGRLRTVSVLLRLASCDPGIKGSAFIREAAVLAESALEELDALEAKIIKDTAAIGSSGQGPDTRCRAHSEKAA